MVGAVAVVEAALTKVEKWQRLQGGVGRVTVTSQLRSDAAGSGPRIRQDENSNPTTVMALKDELSLS